MVVQLVFWWVVGVVSHGSLDLKIHAFGRAEVEVHLYHRSGPRVVGVGVGLQWEFISSELIHTTSTAKMLVCGRVVSRQPCSMAHKSEGSVDFPTPPLIPCTYNSLALPRTCNTGFYFF